jgi:hypothetical protein
MKKLYIQRDGDCEIADYKNYTDISKEQYQELLIQYLKKTKPDKLKFNPTFIDVIDGRLRFGMAKHYGVLSVDLHIILKVLECF